MGRFTEDEQSFIDAAHHAGFDIRQSGKTYLLFNLKGNEPLAQSSNIFDLGKEIQSIMRACGHP